eukprot:m.7277 g.7277  ORF g.7277 m.7277 type:complete len:464 (-) comp4994_c0_seq1:78-1469(-)
MATASPNINPRIKAIADCTQQDIERALQLDERGCHREALDAYIQSMESIQRGIDAIDTVTCGINASGAGPTKDKLSSHARLIQGRIRELSEKLANQPASTTLPPAAPAAPAVVLRPARPTSAYSLRPTSGRTNSGPRSSAAGGGGGKAAPDAPVRSTSEPPSLQHLAGVEQHHLKIILDEIIDKSPSVSFADVMGLDAAKQALKEIVILPSLRPELFTGLRAPARGVLLFGPPGNGKTMLAKAVATEAKARFFSISASSLTSKWMGESEKLVRALFAVARHVQPSVIFIDEIDSLLTQRAAGEHEASRRLKTEFLVQFDGVASGGDERVLVLGATNTPQELDDAALRRFTKRIYVPMPDQHMRETLLRALFSRVPSQLKDSEIADIAKRTEGYSCSDLTALAREAAIIPLRALGDRVRDVSPEDVRKVSRADALLAMDTIRRSVPPERIVVFDRWNDQYGVRA